MNIKSHAPNPKALSATMTALEQKISQRGDLSYASVDEQLQLLQELAEFPFGRFLIVNQGINGCWTDYFLTFPWHGAKTGLNSAGEPLSKLERFLLENAPAVLATQQRFQIFLRENQKIVQNGHKLASIPCGLFGELLYLDYSGITDISLQGIDLDADGLEAARENIQQHQLSQYAHLYQKDAWHLDIHNQFNLISSNGLNIYEPDDEKVLKLYSQFYTALTDGGILVSSFLTYPPALTDQCEWDMTKINLNDLLLQKIIFSDIIGVKFQCYRSTEQTCQQLSNVGFKTSQVIYDNAKIFPTVVAMK